jgi:hypothetical protein
MTRAGRARTRTLTGLPTTVRRRAIRLMNQQYWCWGQDIRRPEGNLLLAYGCQRVRPPAGVLGSTRYALSLRADCEITFWGFGLTFASAPAGTLFLPRSGFAPRLAPAGIQVAEIWSLDDVPSLPEPVAGDWPQLCHLLASLTRWIAEYEEWVLTRYGAGYRAAVVAQLPYTTEPVEEMPLNWRQLAANWAAPAQAGQSGGSPLSAGVRR